MEIPKINLSKKNGKNLSLEEECDISNCSDEWDGGQGIIMPQGHIPDESPTSAVI